MNFELYAIYFIYTVVYVFYAVCLKYVLNFRAAKYYQADDLLADGNLALGLRRSGAQFGLAIVMMGVLSGGSVASLVQDIITTVLYGLIGTLFIVSSLLVTDHLVLPGINNHHVLKENNRAVGLVEFGMLVATGIIAYSSMVGDTGGILATIAYFVIGQVTLLILILLYDKVVVRKFDIVRAVSENNTASGIYLAGKLIAYSLILKSAIAGNSPDTGLADLAIEYLLVAAIGMVMLYVFELLIDLVIVTTSSVSEILNEDRVVPALQLSAAKIGVALILSNAIL